MSIKSWPAAHRHKGGIIKYLYDKIKALDSDSGDIAEIKEAIGDASDPAEGTILYRLSQLEEPQVTTQEETQ